MKLFGFVCLLYLAGGVRNFLKKASPPPPAPLLLQKLSEKGCRRNIKNILIRGDTYNSISVRKKIEKTNGILKKRLDKQDYMVYNLSG